MKGKERIVRELVRNLKNGKIYAFEQLYHIYSSKLYHFGLKYLKSEPDAEELVQNVFEKIWEKRTSIDIELSFSSYIFTIALNFIRKSYNNKVRLRKYLESEAFRNDLDNRTSQLVDYQSILDYLNAIIKKLPDRRREIFIKCKIEDLSIKDVARQMDISPKTVENQLSSAIKFIRSNFREDDINGGLLFSFLFFG